MQFFFFFAFMLNLSLIYLSFIHCVRQFLSTVVFIVLNKLNLIGYLERFAFTWKITIFSKNLSTGVMIRTRNHLWFMKFNICSFALYKQELKCQKTVLQRPQWSEDAITQLQGYLAYTEWDIFDRDLNFRVSAITDYIIFCMGITILNKSVAQFKLTYTTNYTKPEGKIQILQI